MALKKRIKVAPLTEQTLRFSVSLVTQGGHRFYSLTMPSDVLAKTCFVTTRQEDPKAGFQRTLDVKRAQEIADYMDNGFGCIPNSIVLSAQPDANLKDVGGGKTIEFDNNPWSFLVLDGQHRVYGFSLANTALRVPVVIFNNLSRADETRLFIDINTKQRPVPTELLLDIKRLADYESQAEQISGEVFDLFLEEPDSPLLGLLSSAERAGGKISRVTFYAALKPMLESFAGRSSEEIYAALAPFLTAIIALANKKKAKNCIVIPVVFRAFMLVFSDVGQRVQDKFGAKYTYDNFNDILVPMFDRLPLTLLLDRSGGIKDRYKAFAKALKPNFTL